MKKILVFSVLFVTIILGFFIIKDTWAIDNSVSILDTKFEYNDDFSILKNEAIKYIDLIDNSLFETYKLGNLINLNEDYEFMTNFAISFVLLNEDYYKDDIIIGDTYEYVDDLNNIYKTNKYINLNILYNITESIFGLRDYTIINNNLTSDGNLIPLLIDSNVKSEMIIDKVSEIKKQDDLYLFYVKYKNLNYRYIYKFELDNNIFHLVNVDIEV